jgi:HlyD family secretion protein
MPSDPAFLDDRARAEAEARVKGAEAGQRRAAANFKRAQLTRQYARAELLRARGLHTKGISAQELEHLELKDRTASEEEQAALFAQQMADYELELAQAVLVRSRPASPGEAELRYLEISSPITGRVLRVFQESETVVSVGQHLLEVGDPETLECEIDVLSADAVKIKEGAPAFLEHWGGEKPLKCHVRRIEPAGFTKISALGVEEQRVWVIIDFDDPREARQTLGDAFRVEARIVIWEGKDVLKVPASALFRKGDGWAVFLAEEGRAVLQPVAIGHSNGLDAEVLDGLQEGNQVVVHPSDKIKHDVAIVAR